jgi:hypothetical protein
MPMISFTADPINKPVSGSLAFSPQDALDSIVAFERNPAQSMSDLEVAIRRLMIVQRVQRSPP